MIGRDVRGEGCVLALRARRLGLLALGGPIIWVLFDAITTGDPLYSLTGTQETVESLKRQTGPVDLILYGPRALGEVMQWPGMIGAARRRRPRLRLPAPPLRARLRRRRPRPRRLRLPRRGGPGDHRPLHDARRRRSSRSSSPSPCSAGACSSPATPGAGAGRSSPALVLLMFVLWLPNQWDLDSHVNTDLTNQARIESDLTDLVDAGAFEPALRPDRRPQPPRRPPPRLRPRHQADRDRQRQRGRRPAPRLLRRPRPTPS